MKNKEAIDILTLHCYGDNRLEQALNIAIDAIQKLDKIKHIKTECADCDEYKSCEGCGGYLQYEQEVHRILEGIK